MKRYITVLLICVTFFSISASAQMGKMGIAKQTLMDSLKVSDMVADSILSIQKQSFSQMRAIMSDDSLSMDQKKEKAKPIKQEMKTKLKAMLNDEQLQKLQEMEMKMRQKMKN